MTELNLDKIEIGKEAIVKKIIDNNLIKRRLLDIGLTPGTRVYKVMTNFSNNLVAYMIRGALIAIRNEDANNVIVEVI